MLHARVLTLLRCVACLLILTGGVTDAHAQNTAPIRVTTTAVDDSVALCNDTFSASDLDHFTSVAGPTVDQFEANGAGLGIGDLDNDGDLDIVLGNDAGANSILWNDGGLSFRVQRMSHGDTRTVNLVDVDGDGWLDIVFTRRTGGLTYWRNTGDGQSERFVREPLPGVAHPAYAMAWADLDRDDDLDFVTGSYDAGLLSDLGNSFLLNKTGGVFVYENRDGRFRGASLAGSAQAMAIQLFDADRDGQQDIVVGNDFNVPDYLWLRRGDGWERSRFDATSHSTMSLDAGDIDNDGVPELFSSDMMPYDDSPATVAAWESMMASMVAPHLPGDPQIMSNVLQIYTGVTGYQNAARQRGLDATGWTWSAKFGDLDSDGLLDLYAVNGFIESTIFASLPDHELVEENQALRNLGDGRFRPQTAWRLNSIASGRGMSMADLDGDGDLDIAVNNLRAPAQLFENRLCGGDSVQVDLRWPDSGNSHAIGATVALHTDQGTFWRDVRSGSGYLSGDTSRLHFGIPRDAVLQRLEIHWPDGAVSYVLNPARDTLITVARVGEITTAPSRTDLPAS